jgi:hypothetical protein
MKIKPLLPFGIGLTLATSAFANLGDRVRVRSWAIVRDHLEQIIRLDPLGQIEEGNLEGWMASMLP